MRKEKQMKTLIKIWIIVDILCSACLLFAHRRVIRAWIKGEEIPENHCRIHKFYHNEIFRRNKDA